MITGVLHQPKQGEKVDAVGAAPVDEHLPEGVQDWLRSGEPLLLLCLMPGGGSFNHCAQALCTCRAAMRLGQSGAA
ncbi:hypothetical protein D3C87_1276550 [compost metagenome]